MFASFVPVLFADVDPLWPVLLGLRYMHILGAITMMGATIFMRFALVPAIGTISSDAQNQLHENLRKSWSRWVMLATLLLLVSGIANMGLAARQDFSGLATNATYNMLAGIKLLLALPIFFIAALLTGRTGLAKRVQEKRKYWLNLCLLLGLVMVLMGGYMRFVQRTLKAPKTTSMVVDGAFNNQGTDATTTR
jgi:uncharacterized membrane protein